MRRCSTKQNMAVLWLHNTGMLLSRKSGIKTVSFSSQTCLFKPFLEGEINKCHSRRITSCEWHCGLSGRLRPGGFSPARWATSAKVPSPLFLNKKFFPFSLSQNTSDLHWFRIGPTTTPRPPAGRAHAESIVWASYIRLHKSKPVDLLACWLQPSPPHLTERRRPWSHRWRPHPFRGARGGRYFPWRSSPRRQSSGLFPAEQIKWSEKVTNEEIEMK